MNTPIASREGSFHFLPKGQVLVAYYLDAESMRLRVLRVLGWRDIHIRQDRASGTRIHRQYFVGTDGPVLVSANSPDPLLFGRLVGIGPDFAPESEWYVDIFRQDRFDFAKLESLRDSDFFAVGVERPTTAEWRLMALAALGTEKGYGWLGDNRSKVG